MRSRPLRSATALLFAACAFLASCYDSAFGEKDDVGSQLAPTVDIGTLRRLYAGETTRIDEDITITGRVTSDDRSENFYRTLCIEQDGAGIEIMAGIDHLHNDFPIGCRVVVRLKGLALGQSHGVLQIGRLPAPGSGYATDYIGSKAALDGCLQRTSEQLETMLPTDYTLAALTPSRAGTLVRITGVRYAPEELVQNIWSGYVRFTDDSGAEIFTYVRPYARFADKPVPQLLAAITGILQYDPAGDGRYVIKLRDEDDCVF